MIENGNNGQVVKNKLSFVKKVALFFGIVGPGIITASAGNDAGGITTYSVAGAHFGYSTLWVFLPMLIPLIVLQEMCARMGVVTGKGLADLIRERFGVKITFYAMLLFLFSAFINTLSEFSGIAAGFEIFGVPRYISLPIAASAVWWIVVKWNYKSVEKVFLFGAFFYITYIITGFLAQPEWNVVAQEMLKPRMPVDKKYLFILMGIVGTTIAPWMQFYQQSTIVEKGISIKDYKYTKIDIITGGIVMIAVALFIVIVCAGTLFKMGVRVETAKDAALALKPLSAHFAFFDCFTLFALGLINASLFSAMILPIAAAYSACEGLGWEAGVDKRLKDAPQFYVLFTLMIVAGAGVIMLPKVDLVMMMLVSQVANSVFLPLALILILILINDKHLMGKYKNTFFHNIISLITVVVTIMMTVGLTVMMLFNR